MRRNPKVELTIELLREALAYDPTTGNLFHLRPPGRNKRTVDTEKPTAGLGRYIRVSVYDHRLLAHRVAWALAHGLWPLPYDIDHINGNQTDNRLCNLRPATHAQNLRNRGATRASTTGAKGVFRLPSGRYMARIKHNYRPIHLGTYDTIEAAKNAYDKAARELQREFFHSA